MIYYTNEIVIKYSTPWRLSRATKEILSFFVMAFCIQKKKESRRTILWDARWAGLLVSIKGSTRTPLSQGIHTRMPCLASHWLVSHNICFGSYHRIEWQVDAHGVIPWTLYPAHENVLYSTIISSRTVECS